MNKTLLIITICASIVIISLLMKIDRLKVEIRDLKSKEIDLRDEAEFWFQEALCLDQEFHEAHTRIKKYIRKSHEHYVK